MLMHAGFDGRTEINETENRVANVEEMFLASDKNLEAGGILTFYAKYFGFDGRTPEKTDEK